MANHNDLGKQGEDLALQLLLEKGYTLLAQNWRYRKAEIDLIVKDEVANTLIFVEVKTRSTDIFGNPEAFVTPKKERLMADAAQIYCHQIQHDWEIRFDIISVILTSKNTKIEHFPDAFFPNWF